MSGDTSRNTFRSGTKYASSAAGIQGAKRWLPRRRAGYHTSTISSRACGTDHHGSCRALSTRCSDTTPSSYGPVTGGSRSSTPVPAAAVAADGSTAAVAAEGSISPPTTAADPTRKWRRSTPIPLTSSVMGVSSRVGPYRSRKTFVQTARYRKGFIRSALGCDPVAESKIADAEFLSAPGGAVLRHYRDPPRRGRIRLRVPACFPDSAERLALPARVTARRRGRTRSRPWWRSCTSRMTCLSATPSPSGSSATADLRGQRGPRHQNPLPGGDFASGRVAEWCLPREGWECVSRGFSPRGRRVSIRRGAGRRRAVWGGGDGLGGVSRFGNVVADSRERVDDGRLAEFAT
jgi:hypothetical protein